ncbi:MAG: plastocyanin/azurin family copper-binding protein [Thaumarchaeota archaeon]|nr:plastocyanin/azurin family copper-binding protein [Nitrososphaerota archaeon]
MTLVRAMIATVFIATALSMGTLAMPGHTGFPAAHAQAPAPMMLSELSAGFERSAERINSIRTLLEAARAEYTGGNSLQAGELVREAYLNEFEFVRHDLDAAGQPLLRQSIETALNETLISEIRRNSPNVPQTLEMVMSQLALAESALREAAANHGMPSAEPGTRTDYLAVKTPEGSGVPGCEAEDTCFIPSTIEVGPGTTVTWENNDIVAHTVTSGSLADGGPDGLFDSGLALGGTVFEHTFEEVGVYPYFCIVHPWMSGVVLVTEDARAKVAHGSPDGKALGGNSSEHGLTMALSGGDVVVGVSATGSPTAGEPLALSISFTDAEGSLVEHANFDVFVRQGTMVVYREDGSHAHQTHGPAMVMTRPLATDGPLDVEVTFQGFGLPGTPMGSRTGPVGEAVRFERVSGPDTAAIPPPPSPQGAPGVDLSRMRMSTLGDGHRVYVGLGEEPAAGSPVRVLVEFTDTADRPAPNVNYDVSVEQRGISLASVRGAHDSNADLNPIVVATSPLRFGDSVDVTVTFGGFGAPGGELAGPVGNTIGFRQVRAVTAVTQADEPAPYIDRIEISGVSVTDSSGNVATREPVGGRILISSRITNNMEAAQDYAHIVQVNGPDGLTVALTWSSGTLRAGASSSPTSSWIPQDPGEHEVSVFVWESIDNPVPLSVQATSRLVVTAAASAASPDPRFAPYMAQGDDPQAYVDRYESDPAYRAWFDSGFPGLTIRQAVGLEGAAPTPRVPVPATGVPRQGSPDPRFAPFMTPGSSPQIYVDRYNSDPAYREWFDLNFAGLTIEQASGWEGSPAVEVSVDRRTYRAGDTVSIEGRVHERDAGSPTMVRVFGPSDALASLTRPSLDGDGAFSSLVETSESWTSGTHTVEASHGTKRATATFRLTGGQEVGAGEAARVTSIETDRRSYSHGETVTVSGEVSKRAEGMRVLVRVTNQQGEVAAIRLVAPDSDGSFSVAMGTGNQNWGASGTYKAAARYGLGETLEATFSFAGSAGTSAGVTVSVDRESYEPGDRVTVRGTVRTLLPNTPVEITVHTYGGSLVHSGNIQGLQPGNSFVTTLGTGTWGGLGTYLVRAAYGTAGVPAQAEVTLAEAADTGPVTFRTDMASYGTGQTVTVTGTVHRGIAGPLSIVVLAPNGERVLADQPTVRADGTFRTSFDMGGLRSSQDGTYTITATYSLSPAPGTGSPLPPGTAFVPSAGDRGTARATIEFHSEPAPQPAAPRPTTARPAPNIDPSLAGITFQIAGGGVSSVVAGTGASILVTIDADRDGTLSLTIPRDTLESKTEGSWGDDVPFSVIVNDRIADAAESGSRHSRTLVVDFYAGAGQVIEVIGSWITGMHKTPELKGMSIAAAGYSYSFGDTITVRGTVDSRVTGAHVDIDVISPSGVTVRTSQAYVDMSRSYTDSFVAESRWLNQDMAGTYTIRASYAGGAAAETTVYLEDSSRASTMSLSSDRSRYSYGDTVHITGSVSDRSSGSVAISVTSPTGSRIFHDTARLDVYGSFSTSFSASGAKWIGAGTYHISASASDQNGAHRIEFVGAGPTQPLAPGTIRISADRDSYTSGSTVTITGTRPSGSSLPLEGTLSIVITSPGGASAISGHPSTPGPGGTFTHSFVASGSLWSELGSYRITLESTPAHGRILIDSIAIRLVEEEPAPPMVRPVSLAIAPIPEQQVRLGSTLTFTARVTDASLTGVAWDLGSARLDGSRIGPSGTFEWTPSSADLTDPRGVTYTVLVRAHHGSQTASAPVTILLLPLPAEDVPLAGIGPPQGDLERSPAPPAAPPPRIAVSGGPREHSFMVGEPVRVSFLANSTHAGTVSASVSSTVRGTGAMPVSTADTHAVSVPPGASSVSVVLGSYSAPTTLSVDLALSHGGALAGLASTTVYIVPDPSANRSGPAPSPPPAQQPEQPPPPAPSPPPAQQPEQPPPPAPSPPPAQQPEQPAPPPAQPESPPQPPPDPPAAPPAQQPATEPPAAPEEPPAQPPSAPQDGPAQQTDAPPQDGQGGFQDPEGGAQSIEDLLSGLG